jgi:hypothetical protein
MLDAVFVISIFEISVIKNLDPDPGMPRNLGLQPDSVNPDTKHCRQVRIGRLAGL